MLQLYYFPDNASLAPHLFLAETHAEYSLRLVDRNSNAQKSKEYLKLNPAGRIPTLVHNELVLFESPAICIYICELDISSQFIPPIGHPHRPLFFQWLAYLNNTLQAEFMVWRYPDRHTTDAKGIDGIKASQDLRLTGVLALLDEELSKRRFLLGDNVSACDHFLFMLALWCEKISRPPTSFANLLRFMREMSQRPAVQRVCEIENITLDRYSTAAAHISV
jgi:glutathione S-transferase